MLKFFLVDVPAAVTQVSFSDGLVVSFHVILLFKLPCFSCAPRKFA